MISYNSVNEQKADVTEEWWLVTYGIYECNKCFGCYKKHRKFESM